MKTQRGNILFLILLAVVLFAALSYAVTSSMRGGGKSAAAEAASAKASAILQHAVHVEQAIMRLKLVNDCRDEQISFENSAVTGYAYTTPDKCKLFHPDGGGLVWQTPPVSANDGSDYFYRSLRVYGVGLDKTQCYAPACMELVIMLGGVTDELCRTLNEALLFPPTIHSQDNGDNYETIKFTGVYSLIHDIDGATAGRTASCTRGATSGKNYFYYVLIAR